MTLKTGVLLKTKREEGKGKRIEYVSQNWLWGRGKINQSISIMEKLGNMGMRILEVRVSTDGMETWSWDELVIYF